MKKEDAFNTIIKKDDKTKIQYYFRTMASTENKGKPKRYSFKNKRKVILCIYKKINFLLLLFFFFFFVIFVIVILVVVLGIEP